MDQKFRRNPMLLSLAFGLFWMVFSACVSAKEINQLKKLEVRPQNANQIQIVLEFSGAAIDPKSFSIENPASIVFDFLSVKNKLSKEMSNQIFSEGILKKINVIETDTKTRVVMDVRHLAPFKTEIQGNVLKITLDTGVIGRNAQGRKRIGAVGYQIKAFDFRRGDHGEARILVDLSTEKATIDFKEEGGKIITQFIGASIQERLMKRYDVSDFGTPVKSIVINQNGPNVEMVVDSTGNYDKIAYQLGNEYIIEVRDTTKSGGSAFKELTGKYKGGKISLNFQDIEIRAVLQIIADFSGFNIITSDSVKGNITLRLQNVPWDQALDIILKSEGLDKRQFGNVMLVGPSDELAAREKVELDSQKQVEDLGQMQSELFQVNYATADDLATMLKDKTNSLMTARGTVTVDKRTNTLLIQDVPSRLAEIRGLLQKLDVPVRQVEISTQIVTADQTLENALGIRFGGGANAGIGHRRLGVGGTVDRARGIADFTNPTTGQSGVPPSNANITNTTNIATSATAANLGPTVNNSEGLFSDLGTTTVGGGVAKVGLALAKLPNGTLLDLELQALEYEKKSKTLARPKLVTMDQNKATVEKGVEIPYQETTSSGAASVAYKTAALKLEVTPHITPDDKISLDLSISNDSPQAAVIAGVAGLQINTNRLQTKVLVDNGETVVLGGVLQVTDSRTASKVPFFGDLPIIGGLFRNKYYIHNPAELIIFLTPRIINPVLHGIMGTSAPPKSMQDQCECVELPTPCVEEKPRC